MSMTLLACGLLQETRSVFLVCRRLIFTLLITAPLAGCLTSADNPIPTELRKPYIGREILVTAGSKKIVDGTRFEWSEQEKGYFRMTGSNRSGPVFLAPVQFINKNLSGVFDQKIRKIYLVADQIMAGKKIVYYELALLEVYTIYNPETPKLRRVIVHEFDTNAYFNYILRYSCANSGNARDCLMTFFNNDENSESWGAFTVSIDELLDIRSEIQQPRLITNSTMLPRVLDSIASATPSNRLGLFKQDQIEVKIARE